MVLVISISIVAALVSALLLSLMLGKRAGSVNTFLLSAAGFAVWLILGMLIAGSNASILFSAGRVFLFGIFYAVVFTVVFNMLKRL